MIPTVAVVGQQILYRVRIVRRQDVDEVSWERGLSFPNFRAEWLPGRPDDGQTHERGMTFVARAEDRALFPLHAGSFEIPEASLRCIIRGRGSRPQHSELVRVPAVRVRIVEPPAAGRPDDFTGAVGPLSVQTSIGSEQIHLGESLAVSILVRGVANLWDLPSPVPDEAFNAEVFRAQPDLDLETGRRLYARRYYRMDLVPREVGTLTIPRVRIPYYDSSTGLYEVAEAEALRVAVLPRKTAESRPREPANSRHTASPGESSGESASSASAEDPNRDFGLSALQWGALAGASGCGLAIAFCALALNRRRRHEVTRLALADADEARAAGDRKKEYAALARALDDALALAAPKLAGASPATLREHAAVSGGRELVATADAIDAIDRARFSPATLSSDEGDRSDDTAAPSDGGARAAIAGLQALARRHGPD